MPRILLSVKMHAVALALVWAVMALFLAPGTQAGQAQSQGTNTQTTITIQNAYLRTGGAGKTAAAFLEITNKSSEPDRLLSVISPAAARTEIHTHIEDANGMMMMRPVQGGLIIPAAASQQLKRGGDHLMMMGLTRKLVDGDLVSFILTFEHAGTIEITAPVDQSR